MRYWDTSAILPLAVQETGTDLARSWYAEDPQMITWGLTRVEIYSAMERRLREGRVARRERDAAGALLNELATHWSEIVDMMPVRSRAMLLLGRHALKAADACQLAAALWAAEGDPPSITFVCLDRALAAVARREGFHVLTWPKYEDV